MNQEQVMGLIRQLLPLLAGIAITFGVISPEDAGGLVDKVVVALGAVGAAGSAFWSLYSKTDKAIIERAIALPEVVKIETLATPAGQKLAESVPHENVVSVVQLHAPTAEIRAKMAKIPVWPNK